MQNGAGDHACAFADVILAVVDALAEFGRIGPAQHVLVLNIGKLDFGGRFRGRRFQRITAFRAEQRGAKGFTIDRNAGHIRGKIDFVFFFVVADGSIDGSRFVCVGKRVDRTAKRSFVKGERHGEILSVRFDFRNFRGDGFKALVLAHESKRFVDHFVKIVGHADLVAGKRHGRAGQGYCHAIVLFAGFQRRQHRCFRLFDGHAADVDAVDLYALEHGDALQNRIELLPMQIGRGRDDGNFIHAGGRIGGNLLAGLRVVIHLRLILGPAGQTQDQYRREQRQEPYHSFFAHRFFSFFNDDFIVHAFFEKTILFEKHLLISYILGTSFIHNGFRFDRND